MTHVTINGKKTEIQKNASLLNIIGLYGLNPERVVAEVNGNVLTKDKYETTHVNEGDKIELINFVGGG